MDEKEDSSVIALKVCFIFVILVVTFLAGILPQKWKKCRNNEHMLSIANTFSGGVFLAIAFVHLIPETTVMYY
jgi:threonine/homoserine/homoserine lactone efflux protein